VFCRDLAALAGKDMVLTMNTGAEAVETAIKTARRWGYDVKGVAPDRAKIVVADGNFHGRTVTIVSFSSDPTARDGFGPFTPGFEVVPYGDIDALRAAIDGDTVAFLVEPIQGEAGIIVPPEGYLREARALCDERNVLLMADEIQSGLGRTGTTFAVEHEGVVPDVYIVGKALGGGIMPLSAVIADRDVLGVFKPGEHGSTFGGNPMACAIGIEVIAMLEEGTYQRASAELGRWLAQALRDADVPQIAEVRGRGLWIGIELVPTAGEARAACERLMERGILAKDTHETTIRLAPPLTVTREELEWSLEPIVDVLATAGS
jgi:ornithine--oxo-acid transaminase